MKTIPLTKGLFAIVDDDDFDRVSRFKWYASRTRGANYAVRNKPMVNGGKRGPLYLHRMILFLETEKHPFVDHINRNTLDNRKCNLRTCNNSQNLGNQAMRNSTGFKGVFLDKQKNHYFASITCNYKISFLGIFKNPADAASAYDKAAEKLFGEFARTNKMMGLL